MKSGFRFDPPAMALGREERWLLWRAFGPPGAPWPHGGALEVGRVLDVGTWMDLLARIGARTAPEALLDEVGEDGADKVQDRFRTTAALAVQARGLCHQIAMAAGQLDTPVIFLKGMALHLAGSVQPGARGACDVDVLVAPHHAPDLQRALLDAGFRDTGMPPSIHQLSPIVHPAGVMLEIHTMLWGVRLEGDGPSVAADRLLESGLCRDLEGPEAGCFVPSPEVILAHLLVHGIAQHGLAPLGYPLTRMLADVQDLRLDEEAARRFMNGPFRWIASDVGPDEAEAVLELVRRLESGEDPAEIADGEDHTARLLRHVVAGYTDQRYREALKLRGLASPQVEGSRMAALIGAAIKAVWITDAQIEAIYGRPASRVGYWGWRLWRPFDLVLRAVRYGWAWLAFRFRPKGG